MRTCHAKLRYFDWDGQVHLAKGKTGGQQGDPLEMLIFNLTIHHLWGRVLEKFQEARAVAYADDGYVSKAFILPKGTTQQSVFDVAHSFIAASPALAQLSNDTVKDSF